MAPVNFWWRFASIHLKTSEVVERVAACKLNLKNAYLDNLWSRGTTIFGRKSQKCHFLAKMNIWTYYTILRYATKKRYTVGYYARVAFPKIYLGKFWNIFFGQILITWLIMTSSVTWAKFRNLEKHYLCRGMIYCWKEGLIGFSTSPKPTSYLNPFTSYGNFSDQPIRRLHFFNRVTSAHMLCMMGYFSYFDRGWCRDCTYPLSSMYCHY